MGMVVEEQRQMGENWAYLKVLMSCLGFASWMWRLTGQDEE
jgi:hypothetical protein